VPPEPSAVPADHHPRGQRREATPLERRLVEALGTPDRLETLAALGLDRPYGDVGFDRLARLATRLLGTPIALVSFVGGRRQVFPGQAGLPPGRFERGTPLSHSFCRHVVASREPLVIEDARADPRVAGNPAIADLGVVAYAGWPLVTATGEALGSLCAIDTAPRRWTADDLDVLRDLAGVALDAIEARVAARVALAALDREAAISETLQASLLPERLPLVPGVDLGARYLPAENLIGGDWYDVFRLPEDRVGFVVGDVVGHGIEAAATAARLRSALRGFALEDERPGHVLGRLGDLAHGEPLAAWGSVVYGVLHLHRRELCWARAGHPPPVFRAAGEVRYLDDPAGPLLTILPPGSRYDEVVTPLPRGGTLLLYSDGLVERRGTQIEERVAALEAAVAAAPAGSDALCGHVLDRMGTTAEDDVALLAMRVE
jgi:Stage II sporulation protein E (SpoIIE)/GAF domain